MTSDRLPDANAVALSADFRALFEASPTPFLVVAPPDWTIVAANDARIRLIGLTREDQIGRRLFDLFPDDPADPSADGVRNLTASLNRVVATKAPDLMAVQRYAVREANGRFIERWWSPINTPVLDEAGEVALIIHRAEEVTELVRLRGEAEARDQLTRDQQAAIDRLRAAEAALRASEEQFRVFAQAMPNHVWAASADGQIYWFNDRVYAYSGARPDDLTGTAWTRIVHLDDIEHAANAWSKALASQTIYETEFRIRRYDDAYRWFLVRAEPIRASDGVVTRWVGSNTDVHEQKQTATELVLLNETLEQRVDERTRERDRAWKLSQNLLLVIDIDGTVKAVNAIWTTILGWKEDELMGTSLPLLVHPDDLSSSLAVLGRVVEKPLIEPYESRLRHKDGSYRWFAWTAAFEDGQVYASGRHTTAEQEKTAALLAAEDALRQAQKMEAVGQLTGGVAHDFNNLLTVIKSSTDLLKRPDLPEERRQRYIGAISDTVDRAAKLTGQLLAFARRQSLKPEVFDVSKGLAALGDMMGTLTGSRIEIVTDVPDEPCFVNADPSQFDTAIVNMVVNARDAMDGEGRLTISMHPIKGVPAIRGHAPVPGDFVAVCIKDTGTGITPDDIKRIFEPFFTTKEVGQGTGLGLSQVFGFAKQSGGEVRVQSEVGEGTMFVLYLPRVAAEVVAPAAEPEPLMDGHGTRVLVVEDNVEVGTFATQTLAELGYETLWATNAEAALSELAKDAARFDVVFSDVIMPGMNGIDLAQEIRRRHRDLPVVLTSGYSHVLAQNGTYGFELLHKPYSVEDLSRTLRKVAVWRLARPAIVK